MKDFLGVVIERGDLIVYPGRKGSHMFMNQARVVEVQKFHLIVEKEGGERQSTLSRTDLVTVVR